MIKSDFKKNIIISVILSFCIFFLWKLGFLYSHSLSPVIKEGRLLIFADWATPIKLAICHQSGFNVFYPSSCLNYPFNYGNILLYIPFFKSLEKFYFFYVFLAEKHQGNVFRVLETPKKTPVSMISITMYTNYTIN